MLLRITLALSGTYCLTHGMCAIGSSLVSGLYRKSTRICSKYKIITIIPNERSNAPIKLELDFETLVDRRSLIVIQLRLHGYGLCAYTLWTFIFTFIGM